MFVKFIFIAFLAIHSALAVGVHRIQKRQSTDNNNELVSATHQLSQFFSNTWNTLRDNLSRNNSQHRINEIHSNLTNWRNSLANATSGISEDLMERLHNATNHLNGILRDRAHNDQHLVQNLFNMILNTTRNGTNTSMTTLRNAFTAATKTMAENFSGLANSSLQLASDMRDKGQQLFNSARIRAGNDTNRAVIAANTALNAIRNSSVPINETVQQVAANLAKNAQRLSAQLRNLMNETQVTQTVGTAVPVFRQKAEQSLQKLMTNMNQLRNSLSQFSNNTNTNNDNNVEENEINVIQRVSRTLTKEAQDLQDQINALRAPSN